MSVDCFRELWHNFDTVRDSFYNIIIVTEGKQRIINIIFVRGKYEIIKKQ